MNRGRWLVGAAAVGVAAVGLAAWSGAGDGTVVAKSGVYDYGCTAGGTVTGPVGLPAWGACAEPECWRLLVRDAAGGTSVVCVSRAEYDRTPLGAFRHRSTG